MARGFFIFGISFCLGISSPAAVLRGVIRSDELEGPALANVSVTADGAQPAVTESDGRFDLSFPNKHPGDEVEIGLAKEGYVVVHSIMLQQVLLADPNAPRVKILMAKEGDRQEMARRYFNLIGDNAAEKNYQQQLKLITETNTAGIAQLRKELEQAKASAAKAAEEFARDKPGENSQMYQQAMRLFLDGKLDQALEILSDAKLDERKADAKRVAEELARDYQLKGQLLALKFRFTEATKAYEAAVEIAPDNFDTQFLLASFSQSLNHQEQALASYTRCLELARKADNRAEIAMTLNNLGILHQDENRPTEARKAYEEALQIYRGLRVNDPNDIALVANIAGTLVNVGYLDEDEKQMTEAREAFEEALQSYRVLATYNQSLYLSDVAKTLANLGALYRDMKQMAQARMADEDAQQIFRSLATNNPIYMSDLATSLNNLGILDGDKNLHYKALSEFEEALFIRRQLAAANPEAFRSYVANTLNNMGVSYMAEHWTDRARTVLEEALETSRELARSNPDTYLPDVAETLNNLGNLCCQQNRKTDAHAAYEESLMIYQKFSEKSPERFRRDVQRVQNLIDRLEH